LILPDVRLVKGASNSLLQNHISIAATRKIAQSLLWDLTGEMKPCEACAVGKAQRQSIVKKSNNKIAENIGQRIFIDLTSVKNTEFLDIEHTPKPYWRIIIDETTQMKFSDFFETKIGMVEPTCEIFNQWKKEGHKVEYQDVPCYTTIGGQY
jgi:hypothetical protein